MRYVTLSSQTERGQRYALRLLPTYSHSIMRFVVNCKARRNNARLESPFSFILQPAYQHLLQPLV